METHLVISGKAYSLHEALYQHQDCLSWATRYKIALDVANPSNSLLDPATQDVITSWWRAVDVENNNSRVYTFGKLLHALISAKENAATLPLPSSRRRHLGKGESIAFRAVVWLRRHAIPPLPWACPLCRNYIFDEVEMDGRVKNEVMASPRAIMQVAAAIRVVSQCTQEEGGSRPTMANAYNTLASANTCEIPWALTAGVSIGFGLYRSLATLLYVVLFLYVGVYKCVGLLLYYFPYACNSSSSYDPLDAVIVLCSLLALMSLVLRTVRSMNKLDDVLYWNAYDDLLN